MKKTILIAALAAALLAPVYGDTQHRLDVRKGIIIGSPFAPATQRITRIKLGTATFVAGVAVIADTNVTANSMIFAQRATVAGTSGGTIAVTRTAGTSFTLTSQTAGALTTQTLDTSTVAWIYFEP